MYTEEYYMEVFYMDIIKIYDFPGEAECIPYLEQDPECGQYIDTLLAETVGKVMVDMKTKTLVGYSLSTEGITLVKCLQNMLYALLEVGISP